MNYEQNQKSNNVIEMDINEFFINFFQRIKNVHK